MTKRFKSHTAQLIKRLCERFTAAVLVLLLIVMFIPSAIALGNDSPVLPDEDIPETLTRAQLEAHGAIARLRSEESDEFTFVYLNEDGTRTSYSYGVAVKYEENGEYIDKNNTIKDFNSEYGNTASDVELKFPKKLGKIKVKYNDHNIKIEPVTDAKVSASVNGNTVTYYGAFGLGMDLRYASTMSGMKEDIILQSYQGVNSFSFEVDTDGLELKKINGQYVIADGETVVFSFGDLEVTDSFTGEDEATDNWDEHITYAQGNIQTVKEKDKYIFTITVDEDFLTAPTTVYPVNIDPTFNITSNYIQDTYICEGSPAANFGSTAQMKIGYGASTKRNRILMKLTSFVGDASRPGFYYTNINSAVYKMYCTTTYTSQPYVDVYRIPASGTWSHTGATWNNAFSATSDQTNLVCSTTVGTAGWYTFDVKTAFRAWYSATTNNGLMFRMRSEGSSPNYYRHFSSVNVANSAQLPYLEINYGEETLWLEISPNECFLEIGETKAIAFLSNLTSSQIVWSSSNNTVASVSINGVITARTIGTATITATSLYNPNKYDTCEVLVAKFIDDMTLNYSQYLASVGDVITLAPVVYPFDAYTGRIVWSSNNTNIATVSSQGAVTILSSGNVTITATDTITGKTATCEIVAGGPEKFLQMQNSGYISPDDIAFTDDGFYICTVSIANILNEQGIYNTVSMQPYNGGIQGFFDDWYIYCVDTDDATVYGIYKMREEENDHDSNAEHTFDGDVAGVSVSFVEFDVEIFIDVLRNYSIDNQILLEHEINRVIVAKNLPPYSPIIKSYFDDATKKGSYLIAETYVEFIASFAVNGVINLPQNTVNENSQRIWDAIETYNENAGKIICDKHAGAISFVDVNNLTYYEKVTILATHTGNVSFNSFAAEVEFHSEYLGEVINIPAELFVVDYLGVLFDVALDVATNVYIAQAAVVADMAVGEEYYDITSIVLTYHNPNSAIVQTQAQYHGAY